MINFRLNKKNHKKKKPTCGYREIWICQAEWWELVIQSWKHSYVGLACRLVVGINIVQSWKYSYVGL